MQIAFFLTAKTLPKAVVSEIKNAKALIFFFLP